MSEPKYEFRGVWIPKEVWEDVKLTWMEKCLAAEIDALDNGGGCFASNEYLANKFGSTAASIANQISKLRTEGYVETLSFNGRTRKLRVTWGVKAALTVGLRQDKPTDEGGNNPTVKDRSKEENKEKKETVDFDSLFGDPYPNFPPPLKTAAFAAAWQLWKQYKKERRQPLTPTSIERQLGKCELIGPTRAIAAIEHSVTQGYTGIYEANQNNQNGTRKQNPRYTETLNKPGRYAGITGTAGGAKPGAA